MTLPRAVHRSAYSVAEFAGLRLCCEFGYRMTTPAYPTTRFLSPPASALVA